MELNAENEICHFDRLPNEILRLIFQHLKFADLLQLSTVCHRWNQVIFHHCNDHILFRPERCDNLCEDRSYKHLDLSVCGFPVPSKTQPEYCKEETMLEQLAREQATSVTMCQHDAHVEQLVRILQHFPRLDSLNWCICSKMHSCMITTHNRFLIALRGHMPCVRHLSILCNFVNTIDLLVDLAPNLIDLHVIVPARLLAKLCKCSQLNNLQSLKLEIDCCTRLDRLKSFRLDEFTTFLKSLNKLQKLSLGIDDQACISAIVGSGLYINELEITKNRECNLGILRSLRNLKVFRTNAQYIHTDKNFQDFFRPMPHVTVLDIDLAVNVDIERLALMFPDLRVLRMRSRLNWWSISRELFIVFSMLKHLEELSLRVGSISNGMLELFELKNLLPKLREITLADCGVEPPDFTVLGSILRKPTLRRLNIESDRLRRSAVPTTSYIIPGVNPDCEVYVNGEFVQR